MSSPALVKPITGHVSATSQGSKHASQNHSSQQLPQVWWVWSRILPTKLDPSFLWPLFLVYPVSKPQLCLSLWFPWPILHTHSCSFTSSRPCWPQSLIFQANGRSFLCSSSKFLSMVLTWHFFNILLIQYQFHTHCRWVSCYAILFKNHRKSVKYSFIPMLQRKWTFRWDNLSKATVVRLTFRPGLLVLP